MKKRILIILAIIVLACVIILSCTACFEVKDMKRAHISLDCNEKCIEIDSFEYSSDNTIILNTKDYGKIIVDTTNCVLSEDKCPICNAKKK